MGSLEAWQFSHWRWSGSAFVEHVSRWGRSRRRQSALTIVSFDDDRVRAGRQEELFLGRLPGFFLGRPRLRLRLALGDGDRERDLFSCGGYGTPSEGGAIARHDCRRRAMTTTLSAPRAEPEPMFSDPILVWEMGGGHS